MTTDLTPIQSLPFITAELPGIGGEIKADPAHFVVEEIPLYEPVGEGEHVYVRLTRQGWTTRALQKRLANLFGLSFERLLTGDIAKKTDIGGLFEVMDAAVEFPRFQQGEITYTGPIYGARMRWASGEPGELEWMMLETAGVTSEMLRQARLDGSRRPARLLLSNLSFEPHPNGLLFTFTLPKGAYATMALREFMKIEAVLPEE